MATNSVSFKIDEEEIRKLEQKFNRLPRALQVKVTQKSLVRGARLVRRDAKRRVPVDRGNLKKSIAIKDKIRHRGFLITGVNIIARRSKRFPGGYYSHLVEYGHKLYRTTRYKKYFIKHVTEKPYFRPALDTQSRFVVEIVRRDLDRSVNGVFRRV